MKEFLYIIINKLYKLKSISRSNTPLTRSRANSFTANSSEDMWSPEEHEAEQIRINIELIANLDEALNILGMSNSINNNNINHTPRTSVVPMKY